MIWKNPNKTSPLDSFYNKGYAEVIRIKGCRYSTVYDFIVVCNTRLFMEYKKLSVSDLSKLTGFSTSQLKDFLELKSRFSADKIYKISQALEIAMSEFFVDRSEFMGESPTWRFT